jgi:hypothetical protein
VREKLKGTGVCARAESIAGQVPAQVVTSAASAATAARLERGERITAGRLHLAVERGWRGRIEQSGVQNGLFGPGPQ